MMKISAAFFSVLVSGLGVSAAYANTPICVGQTVIRISDRAILSPVLQVFSNGIAVARHDLDSSYCGGADGCHNDDSVNVSDLSPAVQSFQGVAAGQSVLRISDNAILGPVYNVFENGMLSARHNLDSSFCGGGDGCHADEVVDYGNYAREVACDHGVCEGMSEVMTSNGTVLGPVLAVFENGKVLARHNLDPSYCGGGDGCHSDDWNDATSLAVPVGCSQGGNCR